ncbi:Type II secretion system (T2SS), protein F [uncultured archaeon]|nr:Type II secretion system (T2SS), protein F [uncultured archaeon]
MPPKQMAALCNRFRGIGSIVSGMMPKLAKTLGQAEIPMTAEAYGACLAINAAAYFALAFILVMAFGLAFAGTGKDAPTFFNILEYAIGLGLFAAIMVGMQISTYPSIILGKKVRGIERNLIFALRTLLVEVRSGVTLFDSINIVANGDNGEVSNEFRKAVEKINTRRLQNDALEELAENNPSLYFRRAIWQLVNGLKAGSDVSIVMESLVQGLSAEKSNQVRKYGNSLKMLSLVYMMLGAIVPAMGLTLLIIMSTFPQISLGEPVFWGMLGFIIVGQFMFLGVVKNSRPSLLGD